MMMGWIHFWMLVSVESFTVYVRDDERVCVCMRESVRERARVCAVGQEGWEVKNILVWQFRLS